MNRQFNKVDKVTFWTALETCAPWGVEEVRGTNTRKLTVYFEWDDDEYGRPTLTLLGFRLDRGIYGQPDHYLRDRNREYAMGGEQS